MATIIVVLNRKGGVGKSTITVNLSATIAEALAGVEVKPIDWLAPVAALSVDPQGSASWWASRVGETLPFVFAEAHNDLETLKRLRDSTAVEYVIVDTPGWYPPEARDDNSGDPLGEGRVADAIRAALDNADHVIVPVEPEPLGWPTTQETIQQVVLPRGIPFTIVVSNWDPRDGEADRDDTRKHFTKFGWKVANTVIRRYKLHSKAAITGHVVTQYPKSRVAQECLADFTNLALEIQMTIVRQLRRGMSR
ncbi:ParA family protein [Streptomyces sp. MJM8645]|uniref:ParA family protein n=1 Tax=Streptomycetaceae TaxID=2062 RepID=UPI0007AF6C90|nr:ParA family protein [Streptomyces sp. MJM8645]